MTTEPARHPFVSDLIKCLEYARSRKRRDVTVGYSYRKASIGLRRDALFAG